MTTSIEIDMLLCRELLTEQRGERLTEQVNQTIREHSTTEHHADERSAENAEGRTTERVVDLEQVEDQTGEENEQTEHQVEDGAERVEDHGQTEVRTVPTEQGEERTEETRTGLFQERTIESESASEQHPVEQGEETLTGQAEDITSQEERTTGQVETMGQPWRTSGQAEVEINEQTEVEGISRQNERTTGQEESTARQAEVERITEQDETTTRQAEVELGITERDETTTRQAEVELGITEQAEVEGISRQNERITGRAEVELGITEQAEVEGISRQNERITGQAEVEEITEQDVEEERIILETYLSQFRAQTLGTAQDDGIEDIVLEGKFSSRLIYLNYYCVTLFMCALLLCIPLVPLLVIVCCVHKCIVRHRWELFLTNWGIYYTDPDFNYRQRFIPLEDIRLTFVPKPYYITLNIVDRSQPLVIKYVSNAQQFVRTIQRLKERNRPVYNSTA